MRVALLGAPGSGKSTIAEALGGVKLSFAEELRKEVAAVLAPIFFALDNPNYSNFVTRVDQGGIGGLDHYARLLLQDMKDVEVKDGFRPLLQQWGTDFRRTQDPDYWVNKVERLITHLGAADRSTDFVIDDCRFPNERDMLADNGFAFVLLESGPATRPLTGGQMGHSSERYWPLFPVDLVLDYQPGPQLQANRIREALEKGYQYP